MPSGKFFKSMRSIEMKKLAILFFALSLFGCSTINQATLASQGITKESEAKRIETSFNEYNDLGAKLDKAVTDGIKPYNITRKDTKYATLGRDHSLDASYIINAYFEGDNTNAVYSGDLKIIQSIDNKSALVKGDYESNIFMLVGLKQQYADGSIINGLFTLDNNHPIHKYIDVRGAERSVYQLIFIPSPIDINNYISRSNNLTYDLESFKDNFGVSYKDYMKTKEK